MSTLRSERNAWKFSFEIIICFIFQNQFSAKYFQVISLSFEKRLFKLTPQWKTFFKSNWLLDFKNLVIRFTFFTCFFTWNIYLYLSLPLSLYNSKYLLIVISSNEFVHFETRSLVSSSLVLCSCLLCKGHRNLCLFLG